jgi:predicted Zn-dependent protease
MRSSTSLSILAGVAWACLCSAQTNAADQAAPKGDPRRMIDVARERAATISAAKPTLSYLKDYQGGEVAPEVAVYLDQDSHFIVDPALEAYLSGITSRLLLSWEGAPPAYRLMIKSSTERCAFSDLSGLLVVCTELLRAAESEDELAAVLGHELGHILLGHTRDEATRHALPGGIQTTALLAAAAQQKSATGAVAARAPTPDAQNTLRAAGTLNLMWQDVFAPSWNRNQERDADRFGLDLMLAAGYDRAAFVSLFDKLASAQAARSERMEAVREQALKQIDVQPAQRRAAQAKPDLAASLQSALKQTAVDAVFSYLTSLRSEYEPRDARLASLSEYAGQHYTGRRSKVSYAERFAGAMKSPATTQLLGADAAALGALQSLSRRDVRGAAGQLAGIQLTGNVDQPHIRLAVARTSYLLGRRPEAVQLLGGAVESPLAASDSYLQLAQVLAATRAADQARGVLELGAKRIGNWSSFLPDLVAVSRGSNQREAAEEYAIRCEQQDRRQPGLQSLGLGNPATGAAPPPTLYTECVRQLGYDPIKRREAEAKRQQQLEQRQQAQAPAKAINKAIDDLFKKK